MNAPDFSPEQHEESLKLSFNQLVRVRIVHAYLSSIYCHAKAFSVLSINLNILHTPLHENT